MGETRGISNMAKKQQKKTVKNSETAINEEEQTLQFMNVILSPIKQMQENTNKVLETIAIQTKANTSAIEQLATRPPQPLLPPEVTKLLPQLIQGVISIFTAPDVPPSAAKQGIFDDEMMTEFKKNQKSLWSISAQIQQATLDRMLSENIKLKKSEGYEY